MVFKGRANPAGFAMVLSMIFIALFSALGLALMTMSGTNARVASNHHVSNSAMNAAMSGLEVGKYIVANTATMTTSKNTVSDAEAYLIWANLCGTLQAISPGGLTVGSVGTFTDQNGTGEEIQTSAINFGGTGDDFAIRFYRYDSDPRTILLSSTGNSGTISRHVRVGVAIAKESEVLSYAIASRGRMWVTQNSTIHGPVFSTWNRPDVGTGIETTPDTTIEGSVNTVIPLEDLKANNRQMETLDQDDNPVFDENGNRVHSPGDAIQGGHEGINYGVPFDGDMPGMSPEDYNTSEYKQGLTPLGTPDRVQREYFPHAAGNYAAPKAASSKVYDRKVYENKTFSNVTIPKGSHALFINCTFENVLFVETNANYTDSTSGTNNIRFDGCTFNGSIVSDVPSSSNHYSWWMRNVLYFTGEATFENKSSMQETTILAPNFNVNLGNTGSLDAGSGNVLTGAIVGGIVDIRGNADIHGTIISMYDTSAFSSGYITNIGAADDGGSESTGYVGGTISITPDPDQLLPSGITSPIVIRPMINTYEEVCS
jgi:hypothetical protein